MNEFVVLVARGRYRLKKMNQTESQRVCDDGRSS